MKAWAALLSLLSLIGQWIERYRRDQKAQEVQKAHDEISENPGAFLRDHFNRVRDVPDDADKAGNPEHRNDGPV